MQYTRTDDPSFTTFFLAGSAAAPAAAATGAAVATGFGAVTAVAGAGAGGAAAAAGAGVGAPPIDCITTSRFSQQIRTCSAVQRGRNTSAYQMKEFITCRDRFLQTLEQNRFSAGLRQISFL